MAITLKTSDFVLDNPDTIHVDIDPPTIQKSKYYEPTKPYWLYVLKLEHKKYYVGSTAQKNPYDRIMQHVEKDGGAKWTELHAPIQVMEIRDAGIITRTQAEALERNLTWAYMMRYGVNKVRGGIFNSPERMLRVGKNTVLMGYIVNAMICGVLLIAASLYIMLRHIFNWW
jgi:predicted GIY-YIG superfamily endonuclease